MTAETMEQRSVETLEIRKEIEIAAPIEIAFDALLDELGPESQMPDGKPFDGRPQRSSPFPVVLPGHRHGQRIPPRSFRATIEPREAPQSGTPLQR